MALCLCLCVSHVLLTWTRGALRGRGSHSVSTHQQGLLVFGQSLFGQVALPLDLQLQGLGDVRYDPVNGSQHKEHHMLEEERRTDDRTRELHIKVRKTFRAITTSML